MVDRVVPRKELPAVLGSILRTLMLGAQPPQPPPEPPVKPDYDAIRASDAAVKRLRALHPSLIDLTTGRVERLLAALGHPELAHGAGDPRRRHQRQGLDLRLSARHRRGGGAEGARADLAAPGALRRAHPHRRPADRAMPSCSG